MRIAFRADASLQMGSGHVMRCLALADALKAAGASCRFICREHPGHLLDLIRCGGYEAIGLPAPALTDQTILPRQGDQPAHAAWLGTDWQADAIQTLAVLRDFSTDWLVVDHYGIEKRWEQALRPAVGRIMVIDDLADREHDCDLLLDQNMVADQERRYDGLTPDACVRLLGPSYALLREEFGATRRQLRRRDGSVRRLFVFIGGADVGNDTGKVLQAVGQLARDDLVVDVVLGSASPHYEDIAAQCAALPAACVHRQVGNVAELMAAADLAVGAGGGAMWERCCLGLPSIVISIADNQAGSSATMARQGRVLYVGSAAQVPPALLKSSLEVACSSPELLLHLESASLECVDGRGADRVARHLLHYGQSGRIRLRPAADSDCEPIWRWRNAEEVRRFSGSIEVIPLEQHSLWFQAVLADLRQQILLGEIGDEVVGVLRYEREETAATVSVYLTPGNLGRGLGIELIDQGSRWVAAHWPQIDSIEARIKPENAASLAAFFAAGFALRYNILARRIRD